jgi:predicted dehydrogenase
MRRGRHPAILRQHVGLERHHRRCDLSGPPVRSACDAIAAGKDVYSEWPLTPRAALTQELIVLADKAGARHLAGLQRRLGADYRYVRDLVRDGYIGELRSARLHVSVEYFQSSRLQTLYFTVPQENYSGLLHIYGGHFFDAVFSMLGHPTSISALAVNQFKEVTLIETGETLPHTLADQVVVNGSLTMHRLIDNIELSNADGRRAQTSPAT